jgi:hypothetical protein
MQRRRASLCEVVTYTFPSHVAAFGPPNAALGPAARATIGTGYAIGGWRRGLATNSHRTAMTAAVQANRSPTRV